MLAGALAGPAQPAAADPTGRLCGFSSEFDPTQEGDTQTGEMDGGPLFDPDFPTNDVYIVCTIQVGSQGATHAGFDTVSRTGWGIGAAILPPTVISYVAPFGAPVYLCTEFWIDTGFGHESLYYDADDEANPTDFIGWSASSGADCGLALYQDGGVSGRCSISDPRLLCRTGDGTLCLIWVNGACLVPLPL